MPEHLDDFDLDSHIDRAFTDLLEDVGGRTSPPSASAIIERARRRRTTILAAAAAVVLIAGATAVASGVGRPSAAPGPAGQLPAPHVLDRAAWASATDGWIGGWSDPTASESLDWLSRLGDPKCLGSMPDNGPEPERRGVLTLVSDSHVVTFGALADFDAASAADTSWSQISGAVSNCDGATSLHRATWDGAEAASYRVDGKNGADYIWLARQGRAMGLVWVAGDTTPPSAATDTRVMSALVSGLQEPESFRERDSLSGSDSGSASASGTAVPSGTVVDGDFARALGTWDSGWQRASDKPSDVSLPCLALDSAPGSTGGFGSSVGTNGSYSVTFFSDEASASVALEDAFSQLESCSKPYVVDRVGRQPEVVVASTDAGVVWIVRSGSNIGFIAVQGGHANPPTEVSAAVGAVIDKALRTTTP